MAAETALARVPSGRPPGTRRSVCPLFTAWRVLRVGSRSRVASVLQRAGAEISGSLVAHWERGTCRPTEDQLEVLALVSAESFDTVCSWFRLDYHRSA